MISLVSVTLIDFLLHTWHHQQHPHPSGMEFVSLVSLVPSNDSTQVSSVVVLLVFYSFHVVSFPSLIFHGVVDDDCVCVSDTFLFGSFLSSPTVTSCVAGYFPVGCVSLQISSFLPLPSFLKEEFLSPRLWLSLPKLQSSKQPILPVQAVSSVSQEWESECSLNVSNGDLNLESSL